MPLLFVTGPVRSGKSAFAVAKAHGYGARVTYLATAAANPDDPEWSARIARHRRDRPADWEVKESANWSCEQFCAFICELSFDQTLLIESLGTWLGTRMGSRASEIGSDYIGAQHALDEEAALLAHALESASANIIVVCEQVGWDVVPPTPAGRLFRDVLGRLGQRVARSSDQAYLVVSGFALNLRTGLAVSTELG